MTKPVDFHALHELKLLFFQVNTDTLDQSLNFQVMVSKLLRKEWLEMLPLGFFPYLMVFNLIFSRDSMSFFFFWPHHTACGILVPQPGIEPRPLAVKA